MAMEIYNREQTIKEQFKNLGCHGNGDDSYKVLSLEGLPHKVGKTDEGYPVFFVSVNESSSPVKDITRELLSVEYNQLCRLTSEEGDIEKSYAIVTLRSPEWALQSSFIDIVVLMLQKIQPVPSRKMLSVEVEKLITIFSALVNPPVKEMQGLWGELLVIERSRYPEILINAWHSSPNAKFDFTLGRDKIEVKTTSSENRIHHFSIDQLNPSPSSRLLIASMTVRESGEGNGGKSVRDLFNAINKRVGVQEKFRLYQIVAETVGNSIGKLDANHFDYVEAADTLAYYSARDIPRIKKSEVPAGVTEVKFASSLDGIPHAFTPEKKGDYQESPLFKSIM